MAERAPDRQPRAANPDLLFAISPAASAVAWILLAASGVVFLLALASLVSTPFTEEDWRPFGEGNKPILFLSGSLGAASLWFLKTYPQSIVESRRLGSVSVPTELERGYPPAWVAFARVAHLFLLPAAGLGMTLVLGDSEWLEKAVGKGHLAFALAGAAITVTSLFVLFVAPLAWPRDESIVSRLSSGNRRTAGRHSAAAERPGNSTLRAQALARAFAPFFATLSGLIGVAMVFGGSEWILRSASNERWALVLAGVALIANAGCAAILARELRPQSEKDEQKAFDSSKRAFGQPSRRKKHA